MTYLKLITLALAMTLPAGAALAQTADSFNLTCAPVSHTVTGTDTFGEALSAEAYQGVIDETKLFAIDLKAAISCDPDYCSPDSFGGPAPLVSVSASEIVFDDIAAREVPSNEYNVIAYRDVYDRTTNTLTTTYRFYGEDETTQLGSIVLTKACTVSAYALAAG